MNVLVYIFITVIIIYLNFIYSHLNSGFKQKLLMVRKILLVEMGRSFANYLCGARILLNKIMHVSGVSRSNINCETEAEVVFIGTIIAPEKIWGFCCCCCWAYLHFFWNWLNEDCLWALILAVSRWSEDDRVGELCQLHSLHPVPRALRQGLHASEGWLPGLGSKTCQAAGSADFFIIVYYFYFFLPAAVLPKDAHLLWPLDLPVLRSCVHSLMPVSLKSWLRRDLPLLAHFHMVNSGVQ